jgi:hypothetical protein
VSIYEAIINQNVLEITYKHFKTEEIEKCIVHPQFLKQYNFIMIDYFENLGKANDDAYYIKKELYYASRI